LPYPVHGASDLLKGYSTEYTRGPSARPPCEVVQAQCLVTISPKDSGNYSETDSTDRDPSGTAAEKTLTGYTALSRIIVEYAGYVWIVPNGVL
jgi:hypothetical protein